LRPIAVRRGILRADLGAPPRPDRRDFLKAVASAAVAAAAVPSRLGAQRTGSLWTEAGAILRRISPPTFPAREFDISRYGAVRDRDADATAAIRAAISACHDAGGGRVIVPAGRFVTGPIVLRSNVNLHLAKDAVVAFSQDPRAYLPVVFTRYEGVELMNYSPFIYAFEQENIAITGSGTLDGQAGDSHWWPWRAEAIKPGASRDRLFEMGRRGVPVADRVFGDGNWMRPVFVQPYRCRRILIEGVTILNSPMWELNPVLCTNVTVRDVTIRSHGPNNDGCDPESCSDVLIEGCTFDTGDDCIALKSGRNNDGRRLHAPIENVVIRDCRMRDGHGGVVIGSEISGGARYIFAERCHMDSPRLDRVLRFKSNAERGGVIEHVAMRNVTVGEVAEAIVAADFYYEEGDTGGFTPMLRDVDVRNVTSQKSKYVFFLKGYDRSPVSEVRVTDCTFAGVANADVLQSVRNLTLANVRVNGRLRNESISK
jgi:polygalacturonase